MNRKTITIGLALIASAVIGYAARGAAPIPDISTLNPAVLKYVLPANIPGR